MAKKKQTPAAPQYDIHPSIAYIQAVLDNIPFKTGRSLAEWKTLITRDGPAGEKERREWLKKEFKLGGTTTWLLVDHVEGKVNEDTDPTVYLERAPQYVEAMYAGPKAALRPLHEALLALGRRLGADVKVCPCQTIVPLYRHHVFAELKPATQKRLDLGFALKGVAQEIPARLLDTGGLVKKNRITHRIPITALSDIDDDVKYWLRVAYELDAKP